jgi:hypothetical protein
MGGRRVGLPLSKPLCAPLRPPRQQAQQPSLQQPLHQRRGRISFKEPETWSTQMAKPPTPMGSSTCNRVRPTTSRGEQNMRRRGRSRYMATRPPLQFPSAVTVHAPSCCRLTDRFQSAGACQAVHHQMEHFRRSHNAFLHHHCHQPQHCSAFPAKAAHLQVRKRERERGQGGREEGV